MVLKALRKQFTDASLDIFERVELHAWYPYESRELKILSNYIKYIYFYVIFLVFHAASDFRIYFIITLYNLSFNALSNSCSFLKLFVTPVLPSIHSNLSNRFLTITFNTPCECYILQGFPLSLINPIIGSVYSFLLF